MSEATRDDDGLDFAAWEVPPPPAGIADAVLARMGGTAVGVAIPDEPVRRRRWVIAASAAAALVVAGGLWAIVRSREPAPATNGAITADRAQHQELPGASVDLDRGAQIRWHRTSAGLAVEQRAGTTTWRVSGDERVVIGAAVASIEAAGASLRVEVAMNLMDGRVIGASAVTAAAVAMVTVIVYEGHVKVASSGQTVIVEPGTTYTVPVPAEPVVGVAPVTVGGSNVPDAPSADDVANALKAHDAELSACLGTSTRPAMLRLTIAPSGKPIANTLDAADAPGGAAACMVTVAGAIAFPASKRGGTYVYHVQPPPCDSARLEEQGKKLFAQADFVGALAIFEDALACKPGRGTYALAYLAACNSHNATKAAEYYPMLGQSEKQRLIQVCVRNGITKEQLDPGSCDVDALKSKGMTSEQVGEHAEALSMFELAIRCKPSDQLYELAFMASCNANSVSKSRQYWKKLPLTAQPQFQQMCLRNGITRQMLDEQSDASAPPPDAATGKGQLRIDSMPQAKVQLDFVQAGTTPVVLSVAAGKHKVTLVVGDDKFTWTVKVKAGESQTLSKDLRSAP